MEPRDAARKARQYIESISAIGSRGLYLAFHLWRLRMSTEPSRTITLAQLRKAGACADQVDLFKHVFGKSVELTEALAVEHAALFDWGWGADNLLSESALQAYEAARATAWQAYEAATDRKSVV